MRLWLTLTAHTTSKFRGSAHARENHDYALRRNSQRFARIVWYNWLIYWNCQVPWSLVENTKAPKKPAKAQHRFKQDFADVPFFIDYNGAKATVTWRKRDEMVIAAGATLQTDMPLNKDGSVGFAQRFALTLREEHADAISNGHTTKDVVLKSANEVGHFLYFAGTNTWLQLKDAQGRTLNELSRA